MPPKVNMFDVSKLEGLLEKRGLSHLQARKHGTKLILESEVDGEKFPHARFVKDTVHLWLLDVHGGRKWERTPYRAQLVELLDLISDTFPWLLQERS